MRKKTFKSYILYLLNEKSKVSIKASFKKTDWMLL